MLLGNPADFDRIRARYEALKYPTPAEASFNAARTNYEGLLTGSGYDTAMIPTTAPGQGVSFSVDPNTGQVTTNIPQYEVPTFETIYDAGEGLIGADGLPADVASTSMGGGQALSRTTREPSGRGPLSNRESNFSVDNRNFGQLSADVENSLARNTLLGLVNPAFGLLGQLGTMSDKNALQNFGINTKVATQQIADIYNKAIAEGKNPNTALQEAALMGGVALTDEAFEEAGIPELSINQQLADFQAKKDNDGPSGKGATFSGGKVQGNLGQGQSPHSSMSQGPQGNQSGKKDGGGFQGGANPSGKGKYGGR